VARETVWVELVSYALVAVLGLWMTVRVLSRHHEGGPDGAGRVPPANPRAGVAVPGLVLAAGLTPCPSGIIVLLFALANHVFMVGLEACVAMALGMGATVSAIGVGSIFVRRTALAPLRARPRALVWASRGLAMAGSLALTVVGGTLCLGAWARLP